MNQGNRKGSPLHLQINPHVILKIILNALSHPNYFFLTFAPRALSPILISAHRLSFEFSLF
jgi:hypothetical protein